MYSKCHLQLICNILLIPFVYSSVMSEGDTYRKRDKHERTQVEVVHVIRTKSRLDVVSELSATKRSVWLTVNHTALNLSRTASALATQDIFRAFCAKPCQAAHVSSSDVVALYNVDRQPAASDMVVPEFIAGR
jgi:hypothetical protein